jgi:hypothetical protein
LIEIFRDRILRRTYNPNHHPSHNSNDDRAGGSSDNNDSNNNDKNANPSSYPYRGPQLLHVELALRRLMYCIEHEDELQLQNSNNDDDGAADYHNHLHRDMYMVALIESIIQYGNLWSCRATCTYSDLSSYIEQCCIHSTSIDPIHLLLNWSKSIIHSNGVAPKPTEEQDVVVNEVVDSNPNHKERQKQLRTYICAVQVQFHIMRHYYTILQKNGNVEGLVSWEELVQVWQSFQASDNADQVCHERK